jgi:hypothetical protein
MGISVLLADSKQLESQLLAGSLRNQGFRVFSCRNEIPPILEFFEGEERTLQLSAAARHTLRRQTLPWFALCTLCIRKSRKSVLWIQRTGKSPFRPLDRARAGCSAWGILLLIYFANVLSGCTVAKSLPLSSNLVISSIQCVSRPACVC